MSDTAEATTSPNCACTAEHVQKVNLLVGVLSGIVNALSVNPMFAGFLPPELREQIKALG